MTKHAEQTLETKRCLKEAFWRIYENEGKSALTVSRIAQTAGYNRATFYTYFPCIEAVLEESEEEILDALSFAVSRCLIDLENGVDPRVAMQTILQLYEDNRRYLTVLLGPQGDPVFAEQLKTRLKPLWSRYVLHREPATARNGDDDDGRKPHDDLVLEFTLSGALFMVGKWLEHPNGVTAEELLHIMYHSALKR